jgi:thiaminase (transcriptional activator TenA)
MSSGFTGEMRARTDSIWSAIHAHPFVRGIGDGTLSRDRFQVYLEQDYVYLIDFSRVIALAVAKAETLEEMRRFSRLLEATLAQEMELHRRACASFGMDLARLERTEPGLVTAAYTSGLLRVCYEGRASDILAALLPCAAGYVEIAGRLRERGLPSKAHYRDWIETYISPEMIALAEWLARRMDDSARESAAADRQRWLGLYRTSARLELLMFDTSWEKSPWPACFPG